MVWLKSTTQKEWVINGKIVPRCVTKDNQYLSLSDTEFNNMLAVPVFNSLVKANAVLVLHQEPAEVRNSIQNLSTSNAELVARNTELVARNTELQARVAELEKKAGNTVDIEKVKEEAVASLKEEAVKELQEKQDALDVATAEIEKLKRQLNKAKGKSEE